MSPNDATSHELAGTRSSRLGTYGAGRLFASPSRSVVPRTRTPFSVAPKEKPTLRTTSSWAVSLSSCADETACERSVGSFLRPTSISFGSVEPGA